MTGNLPSQNAQLNRRTKEREEKNAGFKIGVAVPCHVRDKRFLKVCLQAITKLDPKPCSYLVDLNRGEGGLKAIRTRLFDKLFETCDVVLQCDVEFYLFPDILLHVRENQLTSFCFMTRSIVDPLKLVARFLSPRPWTGCYSLPKVTWEKVKAAPSWDGTDSSVQKIAKTYVFVHTPKYYLLRRSPRRISEALKSKSLIGKVRNLLLRGI